MNSKQKWAELGDWGGRPMAEAQHLGQSKYRENGDFKGTKLWQTAVEFAKNS